MAAPTLDALLAEIQGLPAALQVAEMERIHGQAQLQEAVKRKPGRPAKTEENAAQRAALNDPTLGAARKPKDRKSRLHPAQWTTEEPPAPVHFRLLSKPDRRVLAMLLDAEPMDESAIGLAREWQVKPALRHIATTVRAYIRPSGLHRMSVLLRPGIDPEALAELEPGCGL
jgi:hypothetical protein